MKFYRKIDLPDGRTLILRNAETSDASALITYLKVTAGETPYLLREPEEVSLTLEQEIAFIEGQKEAERSLLLVAEVDGEHAGNCSLAPAGSMSRHRHRCSVAIALYQKYCRMGFGRMMMQTLLEEAAACGYEQAELEVVASNEPAVRLYEALGFETYGRLQHSMKYKDGSYCDELLMRRELL